MAAAGPLSQSRLVAEITAAEAAGKYRNFVGGHGKSHTYMHIGPVSK